MNPEITKLNEEREMNVQQGRSAYSGAGATALSASKGLGTITSESLSSSESPVVIPPTPSSTTAAGLSGLTSAIKDTARNDLQAELDKRAKEAEIARDASKTEVTDTFNQAIDTIESRSQLEKDAGLDEKAKMVTEYTNQLEGLERAELNEIRALEGQVLTPEQKNARIGDITRKYAFQKADVALLQSAANRDYETAFNIVNRKIELALEPLKLKLDFQKMFYEENKDLFSQAEQRQFDALIKESDREYETAKTLEKYKADIALTAVQNGVSIPAYVLNELNGAKTQSEVSQVLARNGINLQDPLDRAIKLAQLEKTRAEALAVGGIEGMDGKILLPRSEALKVNKEVSTTDEFKSIRKAQDSLQFLNDFENLFKETGATSRVFSPRENAALKTKYNSAILNLKEFFNLGVLNGPDEAILRGIIPDPTDRSATLTVGTLGAYKPSAGTNAGIQNIKKQLETTLDDRYASLASRYGAYSPDSVSSLNDLQRIYIQNKAAINPDVVTLIEDNPDLTTDEIISIINSKF